MQGCIPSGGSRDPSPCLFQLLDVPTFLGSWPHITSTPTAIITSPCLTLSLLPSSFKDPCDCLRSTQIIQGNLLIWRALSESHMQKVLFSMQRNLITDSIIRTGTSLGSHYSAYHTYPIPSLPFFLFNTLFRVTRRLVENFYLQSSLEAACGHVTCLANEMSVEVYWPMRSRILASKKATVFLIKRGRLSCHIPFSLFH